MAKAKVKAKSVAVPAPRRSWFWLQGMMCGVAAAVVPGTAALLVVLLAPGLAMCATERAPGKPMGRAMLLMGAASTFMPLRQLWEQGGSLEAALTILGDPANPLLSWAASGVGWLAGQVAEMTTRFVLNAQAAQRLRALNQEREALRIEWMDGKPPVR